MRELIKVTGLVMGGMMNHAVQATDLNITGTVVASPCTVDTSSVSQDVDFGQVRNTEMRASGNASEWKPFDVKLINCPATTSSVTVTFTGTPFDNDHSLYANAGTATNVAVQMAQAADKNQVQGNDSTMSAVVNAQHCAIFSLAGRLISPAGNSGPGTVSSVVQMNFTYE